MEQKFETYRFNRIFSVRFIVLREEILKFVPTSMITSLSKHIESSGINFVCFLKSVIKYQGRAICYIIFSSIIFFFKSDYCTFHRVKLLDLGVTRVVNVGSHS